jgi:hypothetical protein
LKEFLSNLFYLEMVRSSKKCDWNFKELFFLQVNV